MERRTPVRRATYGLCYSFFVRVGRESAVTLSGGVETCVIYSLEMSDEHKKPTVKGRWANLMFSQRNNPYCDLLKNILQI